MTQTGGDSIYQFILQISQNDFRYKYADAHKTMDALISYNDYLSGTHLCCFFVFSVSSTSTAVRTLQTLYTFSYFP